MSSHEPLRGATPTRIKIFDFDLTLTQTHTFEEKALDVFDSRLSPQDLMQWGAHEARAIAAGGLGNVKEGLNDLLSLEGKNLFCIATYHNNPDFIAGYLQVVLGKEILFTNEFEVSPSGNSAVKTYWVNDPATGTGKPLFISYIPKLGAEFVEARVALINKNEQINCLEKKLREKGFMVKDTPIDFFDDGERHVLDAQVLGNISTHWVKPGKSPFTILSTYPASVLQTTSVSAGAGSAAGTSATPQDACEQLNFTYPSVEAKLKKFGRYIEGPLKARLYRFFRDDKTSFEVDPASGNIYLSVTHPHSGKLSTPDLPLDVVTDAINAFNYQKRLALNFLMCNQLPPPPMEAGYELHYVLNPDTGNIALSRKRDGVDEPPSFNDLPPELIHGLFSTEKITDLQGQAPYLARALHEGIQQLHKADLVHALSRGAAESYTASHPGCALLRTSSQAGMLAMSACISEKKYLHINATTFILERIAASPDCFETPEKAKEAITHAVQVWLGYSLLSTNETMVTRTRDEDPDGPEAGAGAGAGAPSH
jgi:hypothetical protein